MWIKTESGIVNALQLDVIRVGKGCEAHFIQATQPGNEFSEGWIEIFKANGDEHAAIVYSELCLFMRAGYSFIDMKEVEASALEKIEKREKGVL